MISFLLSVWAMILAFWLYSILFFCSLPWYPYPGEQDIP